MIERGCDIEDTDADGFTPWLIAARWARTDVLQARYLLLQNVTG